GRYYSYKTAEDAAADTGRTLHKLTSLGDLMKGNFVETFESLQIGDLLNVTPESDGALLALAYGNKGEDYTVTDGKIVMLGGATPHTVKDLKNDSSLFSNLRLADVLKISPSDENETMVNLAYGKEGKNYIIDGGTGDVTWLAKEYVEKYVNKGGANVLALFDENGKEVSSAAKTGNEWAWSSGTGDEAKSYVAKAVASSGDLTGTHTFYVYEVTGGVASDAPVKYAPRTINDLKTLDAQELMGGMTLESILKIDVNSSDAVLTSLAYGKEGVTYTVSTDGAGKKYVSMKAIAYTFDGTGWADENGKTIDAALYTNLGGGVYEFLRTEDGVSYYAYAEGVSAAGDYALCNVHGDALYYGKRTISALKSENATEVFNDIELKHIIEEDKTDKINLYLLYGKEGTGYEIDAEGNVVVLTRPHTIGDLRATGEDSILSKMRKELTIGDILGNVSDNKILKPLASSSLDTLSADINNLKIADVFESDIYVFDAEGNKGEMKAEWKYLLTDPATQETGDYTINDMSALVENMKGNIRDASIFNLNSDFSLGISADETSFLNTALSDTNLQSLVTSGKMTAERKAALSGKKVGDLTIKELFDYIPTILAYLPTP
ncbi:MAG: hypothetical protein ACI4SH_01600, partial [Candidatus Scatosoma sp.]